MIQRLALAAGLLLVMLAAFTRRGQAFIAESIAPPLATGAESVSGVLMQAVGWFSDRARELVKGFESFSSTPYPDADGYSIGWGHFMGPSPTLASVTRAQADALLDQDMADAGSLVNRYVTAPLTQAQFDALTSAAYNLGTGLFRNADGSSTRLARRLDSGDYLGAADELLHFVHSQGRRLPALEARRAAERDLFLA